MRFLPTRRVEIWGSRDLEKLAPSLPRGKSGFGTSSSLNLRWGRGQGDPEEGSPER